MTFDEAKANFLRDFPNAGEGIPERITEAQGIDARLTAVPFLPHQTTAFSTGFLPAR